MKRLFAFGCSFTQYWRWPTWADALGRQSAQFENWGRCGTGNCFVLYSLMECYQRNRLGPGDCVYIMWTNTSREDRYVRGRWLEGGNVYWTQGNALGEDYIRQFACERGYLIRDLAVMAAVKHLLESWGCEWKWFSMVPLDVANSDSDLGNNPQDLTSDDRDVRELYRDVLASVERSVYSTVFHNDWRSRPGIADVNDDRRRDFHPTPLEHLEYLDQVLPGVVDQPTRIWMAECDALARTGSLVWDQPNLAPGRL
jgi:hypothetical protein